MVKRKTRTKFNSADSATIAERVGVVLDMHLKGHSRFQIVKYGSEAWNLSDRQIDNYIAKAFKNLEAEQSQQTTDKLNSHLAKRNRLYKKALDDDDTRTALQILDSSAKLEGLLSDKLIDINTEQSKITFNIVDCSKPAEEKDG